MEERGKTEIVMSPPIRKCKLDNLSSRERALHLPTEDKKEVVLRWCYSMTAWTGGSSSEGNKKGTEIPPCSKIAVSDVVDRD